MRTNDAEHLRYILRIPLLPRLYRKSGFLVPPGADSGKSVKGGIFL